MRRIALSTFLSTSAVAILYGAILVTASSVTDMPMLPYEINSLIIASLAVAVMLSGVWALIEYRVALTGKLTVDEAAMLQGFELGARVRAVDNHHRRAG